MQKYLDKINSPADLKNLGKEEIPVLCSEIRELLINSVSKSGGHLAGNLGVVELTIALHRVLEAPKDKIIWDVGHQSYVHKILTGRKDELDTLRKMGGLSGFCSPDESEYDTTFTGHASSSLSVAAGIAAARDISGENYTVAAVIGDGAFTGGLAFEALNNIGLPYGFEGQSQIVESPNGIKFGIYTAGNDMRPDFKTDKAVEAVKSLADQGADYIICMFHWGQELYYEPNENQTKLAHACVDAGADLVYGSHPHCLQPIERYGEGLILYSMGNWSFGGSTRPSDPDTAIVQITLKRDIDGTVSTEGFEAIPCCVSSNLDGAASMADNYNNYCPTPYPADSEQYKRVMSKLDGTYEAKSQGADYSNYYASWG